MLLYQSFELKSVNLTCTAIHIKSHDVEAFTEDFHAVARHAPALFKKGSFFLQVQEGVLLNTKALKILVATIEKTGAILLGAKSNNTCQQAAFQEAGITLIHNNKESTAKTRQSSSGSRHKNKNSIMMHAKVRSGMQIYAKDKDLVVCGDVSYGAEIIASGNIFVFGTLNGKAIAGADGNELAEIYVECFAPELISIAGLYVVNEDIDSDLFGKKVRTCMVDQKIDMQRFSGTQTLKMA